MKINYNKLQHGELYVNYGYVLRWDKYRRRAIVVCPVSCELHRAG